MFYSLETRPSLAEPAAVALQRNHRSISGLLYSFLPTLFSVVVVTIVTFVAIDFSSVASERRQFQRWYPEFGSIFDRIVHNNCSQQYELYTAGVFNRTEWEQTSRWLGSGSSSALVVPLVECILDITPEYVKSGMASATVVLGLTPGILATFGSDIGEVAVLSVIGRRRYLALSLSLGSPAMNPLRLFEYRGFNEILGERSGRVEPRFFNIYIETLIIMAEFLLVFCAVANNVILGYDLGIKAVATFAPHLTYLPLLWIFLAAVPHIFARIGLSCLVVAKSAKSRISFSSQIKTWFVPWMERDPATLEISNETLLYLGLSGWVSALTCGHFIFGTLLFSSFLFISVRDSIPILGRLLASVFVCRIVLVYELARLRQLYNATDGYRLVKPGEGSGKQGWENVGGSEKQYWEGVETISGTT